MDGLEAEPGHGSGHHGDDPARRGSVWALSRKQRKHAARQRPGHGHHSGNASGRVGDLAVYRNMNSLDPIHALDYPEDTADSLMCESLLRQTPDGGSAGPGQPAAAVPDSPGITSGPAPRSGMSSGRPVRHRLQPGPRHERQARRVLRGDIRPGVIDRGHRPEAGYDCAHAAWLLAARAA